MAQGRDALAAGDKVGGGVGDLEGGPVGEPGLGVEKQPRLCASPAEMTVEAMGLEPTTSCLQSRCSSQLSYAPGTTREPAKTPRGAPEPSLGSVVAGSFGAEGPDVALRRQTGTFLGTLKLSSPSSWLLGGC